MSLTIFPKAFSLGFTPRVAPSSQLPQVQTPQGNAAPEPPVDPTDLLDIQIIPEDSKSGNGETSLDKGTYETRFHVNLNSNEVVVKVVDDNGKEVRQIPDAQHQKLSKRIQEYQNLAFNDGE